MVGMDYLTEHFTILEPQDPAIYTFLLSSETPISGFSRSQIGKCCENECSLYSQQQPSQQHLVRIDKVCHVSHFF